MSDHLYFIAKSIPVRCWNEKKNTDTFTVECRVVKNLSNTLQLSPIPNFPFPSLGLTLSFLFCLSSHTTAHTKSLIGKWGIQQLTPFSSALYLACSLFAQSPTKPFHLIQFKPPPHLRNNSSTSLLTETEKTSSYLIPLAQQQPLLLWIIFHVTISAS